MTFGVIRSNKRRASRGCIQNTTNHVATTTALHTRRNTSASPIRWVNSDDRPIRSSSRQNFGVSEGFLKPKELANQGARIWWEVVFQTGSSTVPSQKSVLIRTSSKGHCLPRISSRAVDILQKRKLNGSGPIVDYELRQTTMRWAGFCSRESREDPAW